MRPASALSGNGSVPLFFSSSSPSFSQAKKFLTYFLCRKKIGALSIGGRAVLSLAHTPPFKEAERLHTEKPKWETTASFREPPSRSFLTPLSSFFESSENPPSPPIKKPAISLLYRTFLFVCTLCMCFSFFLRTSPPIPLRLESLLLFGPELVHMIFHMIQHFCHFFLANLWLPPHGLPPFGHSRLFFHKVLHPPLFCTVLEYLMH